MLMPSLFRTPTFCRVGHGEAGRQREAVSVGIMAQNQRGQVMRCREAAAGWILSAAPRSKDPKALTALPTPHWAPRQQWAEAGFTVRYLLALITQVGEHGLPTQGLERGARGEDMQTRAIKTAPRFSAQTSVPADSDCMLLRD